MRSFRARGGGVISTRLEVNEAVLLTQLAGQVADLVGERPDGTPLAGTNPADGNVDDPALKRLFPEAYPGDAEASSEFRRFTARGLGDRKVQNARTMIASLRDAASAPETAEIRLDPQAVQAWLRTLTDIRLVLAVRIGVDAADGEQSPPFRPENEFLLLGDVYDWLGWVQDSLVSALED